MDSLTGGPPGMEEDNIDLAPQDQFRSESCLVVFQPSSVRRTGAPESHGSNVYSARCLQQSPITVPEP
jgi:hypothetical protein